ncbi:MAG TPA: SpoIIE family protein phosphatase, partial [Salinivirgaceae bacterium]|nr:SpoIIE family protein phosphatase [Salinivirgaceae bacterium]
HSLGGWGMCNLNSKVYAFVGHSLLEIVGDKVKSELPTSDSYSITCYSEKDKVLFIGGIDNSFLLDLKNRNRSTKLDILKGSSAKNVIRVEEYHIIAEYYSKKTYNIYRDGAGNDIVQLIDKQLGFDATSGVPVLIDSDVYLCASNGFYKVLFEEDNSIDTLFLDNNFEQFEELKHGLLKVVHDSALDGYWATTATNGVMFIKNNDDKPDELINKPFKIIPQTEEIMLFKNFLVTLYNEGICFYDKNMPTSDTVRFNTLFSEIQFDNKKIFDGYYPFENKSYNIKIKKPIEYKKNNLKVSFISPFHYYQDSIKYECILENFDEEWIKLGSITEKEYTNIPPGKYCFKARGINVFGNVSEPVELHFSILAPWYQTAWMITINVIVAILLGVLITKLSIDGLKKRNELLEQTVLSRTKELQQKAQDISEQNEQIKEQNKQIKTQNEQIKEQNEQIKEQSKELELANKQLSQLSVVAQQTDNGVLIIKHPDTIQYINDGMLRMLDIDNFKQISDQISKRILTRLQNLTNILQETFKTSEHNVFEEMLTTFKNRKKWLQITVSPIYKAGVQTDKAVVLCSDVSVIKLAEEEISQQKEELYAQSELLKNTNYELEKANQLMRNSITYAQRIQKSMLPDVEEIRTIFTDTFIFFKPKDIVSGDFYWFNKIDDSYIMIVADCTGHGVPGAFMSMIGNTLLKDTVSQKMQNPAQILSYLNDGIRTTLRQKGKVDDIQSDGMDVTVCIYNPKLMEIQIALANHRALLIKRDDIIIIDGDIFAVGGSFLHKISVEFTCKQYSIERGDILYMYTDGFQDQLGGADYSKYGSSEFLKYLATIFGESFNNQLFKLENEFSTWKKDKNQTDDMLIWGIKF